MKTNQWNIDPTHSAINFTVRHMVFAKVRGRFSKWSTALLLDEQDLTRSTLDVTIDAASIDTGVADRDAHLRSPDFFDAEKFPSLRFKSRKVEAVGDGLRVTGDITIRDVTKEIVLDVEDNGRGKDPWGNQRAAFTATASLNRSDFGLRWNQALEAGGVLVGEKIEIEIEVQAVQAAAEKAA